MTNPNPAYAQSDTGLPVDVNHDPDDFDHMEWVRQNIHLNSAIELRRNDLRGRAEAAGFENVDVGNLGEPEFWEMRFNRGTNTECTTAVEAERWFVYVARGCGCQFEPGQFVVIVDGDRIAARFRLQPTPQPEVH
ncbi:MAG TPA: hypothetical protein VFZ59_11970 [Verrucomicrobiae bacterium]|nr:hypothetical protein [Verrucomicrobiae bacterium]